jgi:uncharacterized protein (TIGR00251 family)
LVELEAHPEGVILPVRAQPGSKQNGLRGSHDGALKVTVTQVAEKGKANKAIIAVLCSELGLRKSQLELVSGSLAAHKRFLVRDMSVDDLADLLRAKIG